MVSRSIIAKASPRNAVKRSPSSKQALLPKKLEAQEHYSFLQGCLPLPGRENEFQMVMNFLQQRWEDHLRRPQANTRTITRASTSSHSRNGSSKSLFVYGTCGSGKTSTVMQALRMCSDRPIPGDPIAGGGAASNAGGKHALSNIAGNQSTKSSRRGQKGGMVFSLSNKPALLSLVEEEGKESASLSTTVSEKGRKRSRSSVEDPLDEPFSSSYSATSIPLSHVSNFDPPLHEDGGEEGISNRTPRSSSSLLSPRSSTGSLPGAALMDSSSTSPRLSAGRRTSATSSPPVVALLKDEESAPQVEAASPSFSLSTALKRWTSDYPYLTRRNLGHQRLLAHYLNCADLTGAQLINSFVASIHASCSSLDAGSSALVKSIEGLGTRKTSKNGCRWKSSLDAFEAGPLHVLALDEVEYARSTGSNLLSELAMYAACHPYRLVLIFISNQRYLVHAPQTLLHDLGFTAYTVSQLKCIAESITQSSLQEAENMETSEWEANLSSSRRRSNAKNASDSIGNKTMILRRASKEVPPPNSLSKPLLKEQIKISNSLFEYIARKALSDFSGDARQVIAMCRRVVFTAVGQVQKQRAVAVASATSARFTTSSPGGRKTRSVVKRSDTGTPSQQAGKTTVSQYSMVTEDQLKAVVDSFDGGNTVGKRGQMKKIESGPSLLSNKIVLPLLGKEENEESEAAVVEVDSETAASSVAAAVIKDPSLPSPRKARKTPAPPTKAPASSTPSESTVAHRRSTDTSFTCLASSCVPPPPTPTAVTLASSIKLLRTCVVEEEAERYISSMTEQMAYVLACLVVLCLKQEEEARRRQYEIRGVASVNMGSASPASSASSLVSGGGTRRVIPVSTKAFSHSVTMRAVQNVYSTLMSCRHFPSMNMGGISSAIDSLADINIITRPHRRGTDLLFSFNGTWSLETIETALTQRGEVLRKEMEMCGLDGSENRFVSILWELKRIVGLV